MYADVYCIIDQLLFILSCIHVHTRKGSGQITEQMAIFTVYHCTKKIKKAIVSDRAVHESNT